MFAPMGIGSRIWDRERESPAVRRRHIPSDLRKEYFYPRRLANPDFFSTRRNREGRLRANPPIAVVTRVLVASPSLAVRLQPRSKVRDTRIVDLDRHSIGSGSIGQFAIRW